MKRTLIGVMLGLLLTTIGGVPLTLPAAYGHLAGVVGTDETHYLYFEDGQGTLRIVAIGPRGTARTKNPFQLQSTSTWVIDRHAAPSAAASPAPSPDPARRPESAAPSMRRTGSSSGQHARQQAVDGRGPSCRDGGRRIAPTGSSIPWTPGRNSRN